MLHDEILGEGKARRGGFPVAQVNLSDSDYGNVRRNGCWQAYLIRHTVDTNRPPSHDRKREKWRRFICYLAWADPVAITRHA